MNFDDITLENVVEDEKSLPLEVDVTLFNGVLEGMREYFVLSKVAAAPKGYVRTGDLMCLVGADYDVWTRDRFTTVITRLVYEDNLEQFSFKAPALTDWSDENNLFVRTSAKKSPTFDIGVEQRPID